MGRKKTHSSLRIHFTALVQKLLSNPWVQAQDNQGNVGSWLVYMSGISLKRSSSRLASFFRGMDWKWRWWIGKKRCFSFVGIESSSMPLWSMANPQRDRIINKSGIKKYIHGIYMTAVHTSWCRKKINNLGIWSSLIGGRGIKIFKRKQSRDFFFSIIIITGCCCAGREVIRLAALHRAHHRRQRGIFSGG